MRLLLAFLLFSFLLSCKEEVKKLDPNKRHPYSYLDIDEYLRLEKQLDTLQEYYRAMEFKMAEVKKEKRPHLPFDDRPRLNLKNRNEKINEERPSYYDQKSMKDIRLVRANEYAYQLNKESIRKVDEFFTNDLESFSTTEVDSLRFILDITKAFLKRVKLGEIVE